MKQLDPSSAANTHELPEPASRAPHSIDVLVGKRVRTERLLRNMSQEYLAARVGITFQQIQKYEKGTNRISASKLFQIAAVLNRPVQAFFQADDEALTGDDIPSLSDLQDKDAAAVLRAFGQIKNPNVRRALVAHIRHLADSDT